VILGNFFGPEVLTGSLAFSFVFPSRPGLPGSPGDKQVGATLSINAPESSRQVVPEPSGSLLGGLVAVLLVLRGRTAARQ
jgi:hypothetical protein